MKDFFEIPEGAILTDKSDPAMKRLHINFKNGNWISIVQGDYSYGGPEGFFEIMPEDNEVVGFLTVEDVNKYIEALNRTDRPAGKKKLQDEHGLIFSDPEYCIQEINAVREQFKNLSHKNFLNIVKGLGLMLLFCPEEYKSIILALFDELRIRFKMVQEKK